jgi:TIR domain-containing protein
LIVVNPALIDPRTHNYSLIETLLDEKVHSAILATSKDSDAVSRLKGRGLNDLVTLLPETLTSKELIQRMRHWAKLGRDKRYGRGRSDERPVFLSFTGADKEMANKICKWLELREIGVWYSFETLKPGDLWIEKIKQGLANAEVFIALISNDYPLSDYCQAELGYILDRVETESRDLPVIPVHYRSPTLALEDRQIKTLKRQAVPISDQEWLLGCQQILETVQNFLKRREN